MSKSVRDVVLGVAIVFHVFNTPFVSGDTSPKTTSVTKRGLARHHVQAGAVHDPERTDDDDGRHKYRETECKHIPALARRAVHMKKVNEVYDDLHECERSE